MRSNGRVNTRLARLEDAAAQTRAGVIRDLVEWVGTLDDDLQRSFWRISRQEAGDLSDDYQSHMLCGEPLEPNETDEANAQTIMELMPGELLERLTNI